MMDTARDIGARTHAGLVLLLALLAIVAAQRLRTFPPAHTEKKAAVVTNFASNAVPRLPDGYVVEYNEFFKQYQYRMESGYESLLTFPDLDSAIRAAVSYCKYTNDWAQNSHWVKVAP